VGIIELTVNLLRGIFMSIFGPEDIKDFRDKEELSQYDLAKKLGVTISTIQNWESGRKTPGLKSTRKIRALIKSERIFAK
jgi:DNA-binding transcriptional regulator YiaG